MQYLRVIVRKKPHNCNAQNSKKIHGVFSSQKPAFEAQAYAILFYCSLFLVCLLASDLSNSLYGNVLVAYPVFVSVNVVKLLGVVSVTRSRRASYFQQRFHVTQILLYRLKQSLGNNTIVHSAKGICTQFCIYYGRQT